MHSPLSTSTVVSTPYSPLCSACSFWILIISRLSSLCIDLSYPVSCWRPRIMLEYKAELWQFLIFTSGSEDSLSSVTSKQQVSYVTSEAGESGGEYSASRLTSPLAPALYVSLEPCLGLSCPYIRYLSTGLVWFYQQTDAWAMSFDRVCSWK